MNQQQQQQQQQYEQQIQQHEPQFNQNQQTQHQGGDNSQNSNNNANTNVNVNVNPNGYHYGAHAYQPGSFPNQPHNSPTFPSNLSPYAQPFVLPSTGGYSYSQTGIPMSLTGMGSLLNTHHQFPGSGSIGMGMGMGMSISPQYGTHWAHSGLGLGTTGGGMGMSFGHMGSYLGASSRGGQNHMNHMHSAQGGLGVGSIGADPNLQIGPGPAGSSVNSAMMMQHGHGGAWGVGGERSRELEKRYVRDFTCCGLKLGGLHDLLEQWVSRLTRANKWSGAIRRLTVAWCVLAN
jgi:type II secretory pathway pseudopilin PulG